MNARYFMCGHKQCSFCSHFLAMPVHGRPAGFKVHAGWLLSIAGSADQQQGHRREEALERATGRDGNQEVGAYGALESPPKHAEEHTPGLPLGQAQQR